VLILISLKAKICVEIHQTQSDPFATAYCLNARSTDKGQIPVRDPGNRQRINGQAVDNLDPGKQAEGHKQRQDNSVGNAKNKTLH